MKKTPIQLHYLNHNTDSILCQVHNPVLVVVIVAVAIGSILANLLITGLNFKLYTEYWKDATIKRRYENKPKGE